MILEDEYIDFIIEYDLTQSQFLMLYLMYKDKVNLIKMYKEKFPTEDGSMIGNYLVKDLLKKELLIKTKNSYEVGIKFKEIFVVPYTATDEIFDLYPKFAHKSGLDIPLIIMDRNVFSKIYQENINYSYKEHIEVLKDIEYGINKNLILMPIDKFLKSKYWLVLRNLRLSSKNSELLEQEF